MLTVAQVSLRGELLPQVVDFQDALAIPQPVSALSVLASVVDSVAAATIEQYCSAMFSEVKTASTAPA